MKESFWYTECVICKSELGKDIGGFIVGQHLNKMVCLCDGCKFMMEAYIK